MNNKKIKPTYDEVYSAYIIASQERYKYKNVIDKIKELINHYAVENEDYSKIYNQEEKDILELLEEVE